MSTRCSSGARRRSRWRPAPREPGARRRPRCSSRWCSTARSRWNFFQAGQPYLWQVSTLLWAWAACRLTVEARTRGRRTAALVGVLRLRRAVDVDLDAQHPGTAAARRGRGGPGASPAAAESQGRWSRSGCRRWPRDRSAASTTRFCSRTFGEKFLTVLRLDRGHLRANLASALATARAVGVVLPLLLGVAVLAGPRSDANRALQPARVRPPGAVSTAGLRAGAALPGEPLRRPLLLVLRVLGSRRRGVRGDGAGRASRRGARGRAPAHSCCSRSWWPSPRRRRIRWQASGSSRRAWSAPGRGSCSADYWDVYVPASLAPPGVLLPLGREGNTNRFPAMQDELRPGRTVLATCALDDADGTMTQYGALLRRTPEPPIVAGQGGPWCFHAVERAARPIRRSR